MKLAANLSLVSMDSSRGLCAALLLAAALVHPLPARADSGGSDCYQPFPQWDQAVEVHGKLDAAEGVAAETKDPLDSRFSELQERHDSYYDGTAEQCTEFHSF